MSISLDGNSLFIHTFSELIYEFYVTFYNLQTVANNPVPHCQLAVPFFVRMREYTVAYRPLHNYNFYLETWTEGDKDTQKTPPRQLEI